LKKILVLGKSPKLGQQPKLAQPKFDWAIYGWANFFHLWLGHRLAQPNFFFTLAGPLFAQPIFSKYLLRHSLTGPKMAAARPAKWAFPQH
jgi:hypothetical protein